MNHTQGFIDIVNDAKKRIQELDVSKVKQMLDAEEVFYLVDVREESEWSNGYLPKAKHISKGVIERDIEKLIPVKDAKLVLYCGGGSRSALAADNLQKMGYTNVYSMAGGYRGWCEASLELSQ